MFISCRGDCRLPDHDNVLIRALVAILCQIKSNDFLDLEPHSLIQWPAHARSLEKYRKTGLVCPAEAPFQQHSACASAVMVRMCHQKVQHCLGLVRLLYVNHVNGLQQKGLVPMYCLRTLLRCAMKSTVAWLAPLSALGYILCAAS